MTFLSRLLGIPETWALVTSSLKLWQVQQVFVFFSFFFFFFSGIVFLDWILPTKPTECWSCQRIRRKRDLKLSNVTQFLSHGLSSSKLLHMPPAAKNWVYKNIKEKCYRLVIPSLIIHERLQTEMEDINHPYHKAVSEGRQAGRYTHTHTHTHTHQQWQQQQQHFLASVHLQKQSLCSRRAFQLF